MAAIDDLVRLVAPPVVPVAASGDWTRVESALGLQLPADFKALLGHYGVGQFDDIWLRTLFLPGNLVEHALAQLDLHRPYLSEGHLPYPDRLRVLRSVLAPTADRGTFDNDRGGRQDHFKAVNRDWLLTYETAYGHQIRVAFAPEDADTVRVVIGEAARAMGCQIVSAQTIAGDLIWVDD